MTGKERLAKYIERSRLKQCELADLIGITDSYLSQLLSGRRSPGLSNALKIEAETGVPVESWVDNTRGKSGKPRRQPATILSLAKS